MPSLRSLSAKLCLLCSGVASLLLATPSSAQYYSETDFLLFSDVSGHWAQSCIEGAGWDRLMSGYPDKRFRPYSTMTRAEFAAVVVKAFPNAPSVREAPNFSDVSQDFWAADAIQTAYERGFLAGYPGNLFKPTETISRAQAMVIIANTQTRFSGGVSTSIDDLSSDTPVLSQFFEDTAAIPNYARPAIAHATRSSLVVNYPNVKELRPNDSITRGQATALLCRSNEDGSDARHYVAADYVAAFGYEFDTAGFPTTSRTEPVALQSFDSKFDSLTLWEGIEIGEELFFFENKEGVNLWKTDGTEQGTQLVRSLSHEREADSADSSTWAAFAGIGDERFWVLSQQDRSWNERSVEIWGSDGTTEGTQKIYRL